MINHWQLQKPYPESLSVVQLQADIDDDGALQLAYFRHLDPGRQIG